MKSKTLESLDALINAEPTQRVLILSSLQEMLAYWASTPASNAVIDLKDTGYTVNISTQYHSVGFNLTTDAALIHGTGEWVTVDIDPYADPEDVALKILQTLVEQHPDFNNLFWTYNA